MQNAITYRLDKITRLWNQQFIIHENAAIARWFIAHDELQMINAFYEVETTEHGQTDDIFIKFETPFRDHKTYGFDLLEDFMEVINNDGKLLQKEGIDISWIPQYNYASNQALFMHNLSGFLGSLETWEGNIIAYLSPTQNADFEQWVYWFAEAIEAVIPQRVKFMVADSHDYPLFEELTKNYSKKVVSLVPNLDMDAAMQELAASGKTNDPHVQFRTLFVALSQASGKGNIPEVERLAQQGLNLTAKANTPDWLNMEVVLYMTLGTAYLGQKLNAQALASYTEARTISEGIYEQNPSIGGKLCIQSIFAQCTVFIQEKNYLEAAQYYEAAAPIAAQIKDAFSGLEAWRMAGYCYETSGHHQLAWECYEEALNVAQHLAEDIRQNSTLPYVGQGLIRLASKLGKENTIDLIDQHLTTLVGENWQKSIS